MNVLRIVTADNKKKAHSYYAQQVCTDILAKMLLPLDLAAMLNLMRVNLSLTWVPHQDQIGPMRD